MVTAGSLSVSKGGIHLAKKTKKAAPQSRETAGIKSFLDMIAPSVVKFEPDHFICGNTFRCVWALREYPTQTDEQATVVFRHSDRVGTDHHHGGVPAEEGIQKALNGQIPRHIAGGVCRRGAPRQA